METTRAAAVPTLGDAIARRRSRTYVLPRRARVLPQVDSSQPAVVETRAKLPAASTGLI